MFFGYWLDRETTPLLGEHHASELGIMFNLSESDWGFKFLYEAEVDHVPDGIFFGRLGIEVIIFFIESSSVRVRGFSRFRYSCYRHRVN